VSKVPLYNGISFVNFILTADSHLSSWSHQKQMVWNFGWRWCDMMTLYCVAMCHEPYWGKVHSMLFGGSSSNVLNLRLRKPTFYPIQPIILQLWKDSDVASHKKVMGKPRWNCSSSYHVDSWSSREWTSVLLLNLYSWVALAPEATQV